MRHAKIFHALLLLAYVSAVSGAYMEILAPVRLWLVGERILEGGVILLGLGIVYSLSILIALFVPKFVVPKEYSFGAGFGMCLSVILLFLSV